MMVSLNAMLHADVFVAGSVVAGGHRRLILCKHLGRADGVALSGLCAARGPNEDGDPAALAGNVAGGEIISEPVLVS